MVIFHGELLNNQRVYIATLFPLYSNDVDGRNPAPLGNYETLWLFTGIVTGFCSSTNWHRIS